jgi:ectoine hydroxylase-related dioxygenase (phytanoyl-CoA dioxygenase family)
MTHDLSTYDRPVTDLFSPLDGSHPAEQYRLSPEQLGFYHENGYVAGIRVLTEAQADVLADQLKDLFDPNHEGHELWHEYHTNESGDPDNVLFHALGAWRIKPAFHDALWNPAFLVPAAQLLGGPVRFWHDQLFCKPAGHGGVVAWHQDYSYWTRTQPMAHLTCWIALDDASSDNGCLQYVPGSHRWDLLPITGLAGDMNAIEKALTPEQRAAFEAPAYAELKRGYAAFHHPLMVHGSERNRTNRPRRGTVINAFRDGVESASDEPLLAGVPVVPKGKKMEGAFFPLLTD